MNRRLLVAIGLATAIGAGLAVGQQPTRGTGQKWTTAPRPSKSAYSPSTPPEAVDSRPLVWVVDGAGDLKGCSTALSRANMLAGNPVELSVFPWSHGYPRLLMDQIDMSHARARGAKLAAAVAERRVREPGRRVVLVAHSAGSAVALAAADVMTPDAIDRLILLAPSVSTGYDVRPALGASREGMDVFCSKKDWVALGFVVRVVGTTDKFWSGSAAGRLGFKPKDPTVADLIASGRLRQHFWSADMAWTGHTGGHHGMHAPAFIHAFLFPLLGVPVPPAMPGPVAAVK
jgi:pimeloyl-ACP methyl ester carboxylesterase